MESALDISCMMSNFDSMIVRVQTLEKGVDIRNGSVSALKADLDQATTEQKELQARVDRAEQQLRQEEGPKLLSILGCTFVYRTLQFVFGENWKQIRNEFRIRTVKDIQNCFVKIRLTDKLGDADFARASTQWKRLLNEYGDDLLVRGKIVKQTTLVGYSRYIQRESQSGALAVQAVSKEIYERIIAECTDELTRSDLLFLLHTTETLSQRLDLPLVDIYAQ